MAPRGIARQKTGPMTDAASPEAPVRPPLAERVVFFGLGLMGGSVARATRRAWPDAHVVGVDREVIVDVAKDEGIIDEGVSADAAAEVVREADLVVLCLPVLAILETLETLREPLQNKAVITDTGSTKAVVCEAATRLELPRFVGGHPMAGKPHGGLAHADADLFRGATWFLCPQTDVDPEAPRLLRQWVRELGARPVEIGATEHDRAVALTSHLPHLVVNALAETVLETGALDAAGGSLRDLLRVAGAPFDVWGDTLATNREAIDEALGRYIERLEEIRGALGERERVRDLFARGRACRERLGPKT
jgi:prephenate dehydrogenase